MAAAKQIWQCPKCYRKYPSPTRVLSVSHGCPKKNSGIGERSGQAFKLIKGAK